MSALNYLDSFEWLENLALGSDILYLTAQCFDSTSAGGFIVFRRQSPLLL